MIDPHSDLTRDRWRRQEVPPPDRSHPAVGSAAFVGQVATASAAAGTFALVYPVTVLGTETEAGAGILTTGSSSVSVLLLTAAAAGDLLVCRFVDHRWVAERGGSGCLSRICACAVICGCTGANGASVTATGPGGFNQSGTTDATGWWCHSVTTPGTYTVTLTYGAYTATKTVVVGTACTSYAATFSVLDGPLYLTTGLGTITLTSIGGSQWTGTRNVNVSTTNWQYDPYLNCVGTPELYSEPIFYLLRCVPFTLPWLLTVSAPIVVQSPNDAMNIYYYGPYNNCRAGGYIEGTVNMAGSCALPFSISGSIPGTWDGAGSYPLPALDSGTVVIHQ